MQTFWLSFAMIFLAELGDKSQLLSLALATCYSPRVVLWGIFWSTLAVHVFSVGIGWLMGETLPTDLITFAAGVSFIIFGFWTLRGDRLDDDEARECKTGSNPFWLVFSTFFMAELGDKTMLSTISLATTKPFIPVWIGSTIGMVVSDALAIWVGRMLGKRLPEQLVTIGATIVFFLFGAYWMYLGGEQLPLMAWGIALLLLIVAGLFFLRDLLGRWGE